MQVDNIRIIFLNLLQQVSCLLFGGKTMLPPKEGMEHMNSHVQICSKFIRAYSQRAFSPAKGRQAGIPFCLQSLYQIHCNTADASVAAHSINLHYLQTILHSSSASARHPPLIRMPGTIWWMLSKYNLAVPYIHAAVLKYASNPGTQLLLGMPFLKNCLQKTAAAGAADHPRSQQILTA